MKFAPTAIAAAITLAAATSAQADTINNVDNGAGRDINNTATQRGGNITNNLDQGAGGDINNAFIQRADIITNNTVVDNYDDSELRDRLHDVASDVAVHDTLIDWVRDDTDVDWETPDVDPGANGSTALNEVVEHEYRQRRADAADQAAADAAQDERISANGGALADHEGRISENGQRLDVTQDRIDHTQGRVDATNRRIDVNDQRIGELGVQNQDQAEAISSNAATNDRQDTTLATHSRRISRNASAGQANAKAIGDLNRGQQAQRQRINENSGGIYANAQTNKRQDEALIAQSERIDVNARNQRDYAARTDRRFDSHASAITQNSAGIAANRDAIDELRGDVSDLQAGVAAAIAASSHAWQVGSGAGFQMSLSAGHYEGESAGSAAIGGQVSSRVFVNGSMSYDSRGNAGYGAGVNIQF